MAIAGYKCLIRKSGVSTPTTTEICTLVAGGVANRYQIAAAAKRAIDPLTPWHFKNDAATIAWADISTLDFAFGEVGFGSAKSGIVSFSGSFLPLTTSAEIIAEAKSFSLSESSDLLNTTVFTSTSNLTKRKYGLADASATVEILLNATDMPSLATIQATGRLVMLEINSGSSPLFRGYGKIESLERSASIDGLVEASITWQLAAERHDETNLVAGYSIRNLDS